MENSKDFYKKHGLLESMRIKSSTCLDKEMFSMTNLHVVGQANFEFIICLLLKQKLLVVFDQHAVHERIRYEQLLAEAYTSTGQVAVRRIIPPMPHQIHLSQAVEIESHQQMLETCFGTKLVVKGKNEESQTAEITVHSIPICLKHYANLGFFTDFLLDALKCCQTHLPERSKLTPFLVEQIRSQACKGAIRFGDRLEVRECADMIMALTRCKAWFRCAHGRLLVKPVIYVTSPSDHINQPGQEESSSAKQLSPPDSLNLQTFPPHDIVPKFNRALSIRKQVSTNKNYF